MTEKPKVTLTIDPRLPQWRAAAWLRETGEFRPAIDILRGSDEITPELREALADWIEKGAKRRRGSKVEVDPWNSWPPKLAESLRLAQTPKEHRAWLLFAVFPSAFAWGCALPYADGRRGRPRTPESAAIAFVAKRLEVSERTARGWFRKFYPDGYEHLRK